VAVVTQLKQHGWLLIYGVKDGLNGYIYSACAALLDLENLKRNSAASYPCLNQN
jgi:predicted GH43/DUF377 family glycosyl hydrolase